MNGWLLNFNAAFLAHFQGMGGQSRQLKAALLYAISSPGKRLRPALTRESSQLISLSENASTPLSFAVEMIHLFSLIHDDLPCLDNDDFRRGQPTLHKQFDESTALLAGDALVPLAYETFAEILNFVPADDFRSALSFFSRCIGPEGMIGGQMLELETISESEPVALPELLRIQDLKTGALFRAAILTPFYLKGISEQDPLFLDATNFATSFGFAFQVADDLEDEVQDQKASRKNILSQMGKKTAIEMAISNLTRNSISKNFSATEILLKKLQSNS